MTKAQAGLDVGAQFMDVGDDVRKLPQNPKVGVSSPCLLQTHASSSLPFSFAALHPMPVSWNAIRHNAIRSSRDWTGASSGSAEKQSAFKSSLFSAGPLSAEERLGKRSRQPRWN